MFRLFNSLSSRTRSTIILFAVVALAIVGATGCTLTEGLFFMVFAAIWIIGFIGVFVWLMMDFINTLSK